MQTYSFHSTHYPYSHRLDETFRAKNRYIVIKMTVITSGAFEKPILTSHLFKPSVKLFDIYIYVNVTCFVNVEERVDTNNREKMQFHSKEKVHRCTCRESKVKNSTDSLVPCIQVHTCYDVRPKPLFSRAASFVYDFSFFIFHFPFFIFHFPFLLNALSNTLKTVIFFLV